MKVLLVFGTRPEAIKMCPIIKELKNQKNIEYKVCVTGQHLEMLEQVLDIFKVEPDYNLRIMKKGQTLAAITSTILTSIDDVIVVESPDLILVHGDTTSAFVASLAAFYRKIPIGHVEAGLRTYDMDSPFPEEFNRQAIDLISDLYFAPTKWAKDNLIKEGKCEDKIFVTGNTAIDALETTICDDFTSQDLEWANGSKLILLTAHRRENIGDKMRNIFAAVNRIVEENKNVKVIYPIHLNPAVRDIAYDILGGNERIRLVEPLDVIQFHNYMRHSYLIMTDSGGIQEEAPSLGKPVLVLRDTTERPEGVEAGTSCLLGTDEQKIYENVMELLNNEEKYIEMSQIINPYGDGTASKKIVKIIKDMQPWG